MSEPNVEGAAAAPAWSAPASQRQLFGHPFGLWTLALTEMWERFSFYGMRALLVYYMTKYLLLPGQIEQVAGFGPFRAGLEWTFGPMSVQQLSSQIYGLYTGFVYLTPILGGWLADRYWGQRRTVILGGVVMAIGEFVLMVPSLFLPGLLLLIVGNGFFKPNISTQVGGLYPPGDPRRDRAFNWFYVGVNVGAALAPLVCGTLGELYGWRWGFGAAGAGMLGGLVQYWYGQKYLAPDSVMKRAASRGMAWPLSTPSPGHCSPGIRKWKVVSFPRSRLCCLWTVIRFSLPATSTESAARSGTPWRRWTRRLASRPPGIRWSSQTPRCAGSAK